MKFNLFITRPFTDWCSHEALFFDSQGQFVGSQKIDYSKKTFSFKGGTYNFIPLSSSGFKKRYLFTTTRFYHYTLSEPMPIILRNPVQPLLQADVYKTILESDKIQKLNPKKFDFWEAIGGWKGVIIGAVILGLIIWYTQGGSGAEAVSEIAK